MKRNPILCRLAAVSLILFLRLAQAQESDEPSVADSAQAAVSNEAVRKITSQLMAPCCW